MANIDDKAKEELLKRAEEDKDTTTADIVDSAVSDDEDENLDYQPSYKPGEIVNRSIVKEMKSNYLDYSMSVIVSRALPEVKDGLKPSQRRILVAMNDISLKPTAKYRKSSKVVGDTSGNYHPHGDAAIYTTMVKLAQDFSTRYPLVDGQGNFGTVDGDPAAAMRYTEARMTKVSDQMLNDLNKGTVTFVPNYDGTRLEPTVLPSMIPNLLINGSDGIAVGMATKIPPHNLREVVKALREMIAKGNQSKLNAKYNEYRIAREEQEAIPKTLNSKPESFLENYIQDTTLEDNPETEKLQVELAAEGTTLYPMFESDISPNDLIKYVPGPDFPLGGTIYDQKEILNAYATGRGRILQRAKAVIEEDTKASRMHIIITEIPYQVNKATLIQKIADLVKDKKVEGIADIRDESNLKEGIRVVVILKKSAQPKTVLNKLYKYTQMQSAFNANMIALVDREPETLSLKRMLELFISFRISVVIRRYEYDLAEARYRGHILEGLLKALDVLDEVIATIRASKTQEDAKTALIEKFDFTDVQAQAILDMQLRRLAALEREKLKDEYDEISSKIKEFNTILASEDKILGVIDDELKMVAESYGDDRRTEVVKGRVGEFSETDLIKEEDVFVTISHAGYIKRVTPSTYKSQKRGGKGVIGASMKDGDYIEHAFFCSTHDDLLLFTNHGRVFATKVYEVPEAGRTAKGTPLVNLIQLQQEELVTSVLPQGKAGVMGEEEIQEGQDKKGVVKPEDFKYLFMATKNGTVKKTKLAEFENIRSTGLISINLDKDDELKWVKPTTGKDDIMLVSTEGRSIRFNEKDVRETGRATRGVRGMKFKSETDEIVSMHAVRSDENQIFTLSEKGYGKMTPLSEYSTQGRGGTGVYTFRVKDKTGNVAVARVLDHPEKEIVIISEAGQVIRSEVKSIPSQSRQTSGVKVMTLKAGDVVAAMAVL